MIPSKAAFFAIGLSLVPAAALAQQSPARDALKRACTGAAPATRMVSTCLVSACG